MPFFEGKQELHQVLCFVVMPIMICTIFYIRKPKLLWVAPIVIMFIFISLSGLFYPYIFMDILRGDYDSTTIYWFIFVVPIQLVSALFFTVIAHLLIKRKTLSR